MITKLKDWFWDKLFLDFYLDKRWTLRFKLMNFISGDTLRVCLTSIYTELDNVDLGRLSSASSKISRAKLWTKKALKYYQK